MRRIMSISKGIRRALFHYSRDKLFAEEVKFASAVTWENDTPSRNDWKFNRNCSPLRRVDYGRKKVSSFLRDRVFSLDRIQYCSVPESIKKISRKNIEERRIVEVEIEKLHSKQRTLESELTTEWSEIEEKNPWNNVPESEQKSLRVGIIGAPNAGKSVLTNALVGEKVTIVSRKTHTTRREILGISTKHDTQLLIFDTPGLANESKSQQLRKEYRKMSTRAINVLHDCEVQILLIDAARQIQRPDRRVALLAEKIGTEEAVNRSSIVCLNKVDLIKDKKEIIPLLQWLQELPGFERIFLISGLKRKGLNDLEAYLMSKAVLRPWEEDPSKKCSLSSQDFALEIVRESLLDRLHEELPYTLESKIVSWRNLRDGSLRIEMCLFVESDNQRSIVVGANGDTIRYIGATARKELEMHFGGVVHLILVVRVLKKT